MKCLCRHLEDGREVRVFDSLGDGSRLYIEGAMLYTHVSAEGRNLLDYVTAMDAALGVAGSVLLLGTAGGALATELCRRGVVVTAVDNLAGAFDLARAWFFLPDQVRCVHADALNFLRTTCERWDAVAVDLFKGGEIPVALLDVEIGQLLANAVNPGGEIVWNVAESVQSASVIKIASILGEAGLRVRCVGVIAQDVGNTLVTATAPGASA
jgi:spermidine synthase